MGSPLGATNWISSLQEWLAEIGVNMRKHGVNSMVGNPQIIDIPGVSVDQRVAASRRGVSFLGEVCMVGDADPVVPGLEWMSSLPPAPLSRIEIRVGQVWHLAEQPLHLFEIISFRKEVVCCMVWDSGLKPGSGGELGRGGYVHVTEANRCRGAGGGTDFPIDTLVGAARGLRRLIFLSEDRHHRDGVTGCTILGSRSRVPDSGRIWSPPPLLEELSRMARQSDIH